MRTLVPPLRHFISNTFCARKKEGHFPREYIFFPHHRKSKRKKNFLNKLDSVITQITQPQASWGQDVQANGADEGRGRAIGGGIQHHRGWGGWHAVALQTQEEFSGFIHVHCIPLHALDYHRLRDDRRGGQGSKRKMGRREESKSWVAKEKVGKRHEREAERGNAGEERGMDRVGNVGTRDKEGKRGWGETNIKGRKEEGIKCRLEG